MKKIISAAAAVCIAAGLSGCGAFRPSVQYESCEGTVSFIAGNGLKEYDEDNGIGYYFHVRGSKGDIFVVELYSGHQNLKGCAEGLAETYRSSSEFSNVKCEPDSAGDYPAYRITADKDSGEVSDMELIQFGDEYVLSFSSLSKPDDAKCRRELENLIASLEYTGPPPKNKPEWYENTGFSMTVPKEWTITAKESDRIQMEYTTFEDSRLLGNYAMITWQIDGGDIEQLAQVQLDAALAVYNDGKGGDAVPLRTKEKFLGIESELITYQTGEPGSGVCLSRRIHIFNVSGRTYAVSTAVVPEYDEQYQADLDKVLETINFK